MPDFCELTQPIVRIGLTADRPATPPDRQSIFFDRQTGILYVARDDMTWGTVTVLDPVTFASDIGTYTIPANRWIIVAHGTPRSGTITPSSGSFAKVI